MRTLQAIMQSVQASPPLLPLLRSSFQGELLAWLYLHPDGEYAVTELARRFGVSQSTGSREADRLADGGFVHERRVGNLRLLRANVDTLIARPLTDLLALTYGPMMVLGELLGAMPGIERAFIYGSWAARYLGEPGPVPRDVDVVVVGRADEDDLHEAARAAERRLGRDVNVRQVAADTWQRADEPFLAGIRARPLVRLLPADRDEEAV